MMLQLHIESKEKPEIYRKLLLPKNSSFSLLDEMIFLSFDLDGSDFFDFEMVKKDGRVSKEKICFLPENDTDFDTDEELVDEWLRNPGDEAFAHIIDHSESFIIRLESNKDVSMNAETPVCIAGAGNIYTGTMDQIDLEEINELLRENVEVDSLLEDLEPDYFSLLELTNDLKKLKPWQYLRDDEVVVIHFEDTDQKVLVSVMGAGGEEFGLMIFDMELGYTSLSKILFERNVSSDVSYSLNALTVNFVDREELDPADYQLIKDCGLSYRGKKNWIQFRSYLEGTHPERPDYLEVELLIDVISRMINITEARKVGWEYPEVAPHQYPVFKVQMDGELQEIYILQINMTKPTYECYEEISMFEKAKYKKKPKSALQVEYDLFYMPFGVEGEETDRTVYPIAGMLVDRGSNFVIEHEMLPMHKTAQIAQSLLWAFLQNLDVRPSKLFVSKELRPILQPLAKIIGIELVESELPAIREVREFMKTAPMDLLDE
ncbi:plasmid pRiA4b ORF-3 family protein [Lysinibacillus sp. BPa_S21]|uniref:plasmid pRiA4b ORF-3 family protein n=1 Tax=Lysinibacillus sp. BPa_S21 TaxID=2932478 RepID=UPI002011A098|nr:plasmid pRiA4b ORF-3 family protein [Lysinibacillus sp. BPa_S21]MCL1697355.1 plasmid pRiA4b ORF-3 family protein [Lysinibacillus sp. BPa_S21]